MIPRRLALKNFLSYGDRAEPLEFASLHVACLTGDNGNGKSALLDAMTWALWGVARSGTDQLVRIGQTEMCVEFDFELEGAVYRVIRKRELKRGGGASDLQFQLLDPQTGAFRSITGGGIRETEARITAALRMDYDTFVNSSFLLQGRADEFTQKGPAERKRILGEILGLRVFDDLEAKARVRRQEADEAAALLDQRIATLEAAQAGRDATVAEREALGRRAADLEAALAADEARLAELRAARGRLEQAELEATSLATRVGEAERRAEEAASRAARHAARVDTYERTLADAARIEAGLGRLRALRAEEQAHSTRLLRERELAERRAALERAIAEVRGQLEVRHARACEARDGLSGRLAEAEGLLASRDEIARGVRELRTAEADERAMAARAAESLRLADRVRGLERAAQEAETALRVDRERLRTRLADAAARARGLEPAREKLADAEAALGKLDELVTRRERVADLGSAARTRLEAIPDRLARLASEIAGLESRLAQLDRAGGTCPLCEQTLSAQRRAAVRARLGNDELAPRRAEHAALEQDRPLLEDQVRRLRDQYARLGRDLAEREKLKDARAAAAQAIAAAAEATAAVQGLEAEVAGVEAKLAAGAAPLEVKGALAEAREALSALAYDPKAHDALRERLDAQRTFEARHARLEQAEREAASLSAEIPTIEAEVARLAVQLESGAFAEAQRASLDGLAAEAADAAYDRAAHDACRAALVEHERFEAEAALLAQASREVAEARAATAEARAAADGARDEAARLAAARALRLAEADRLPAVASELAALEGRLRGRRDEEADLRRRQGQVEARLEDMDRQAAALDAARAGAREIAETRRTFADLARVFGRNGVQAIIIENAIPEIEEEANRLLGRLTDHAMRLKLETQRDKKTGGVAETLEILIADELGTRPYETFSGGEAFRVNFALRIALSRLLARRAGARLQTLVVDEGFGTQDGRGMAKLVEAIHAVEGDFAKILIITHIDELKGAFPSRIEVEKDPVLGSTLRVM